ncbi:hypothetical protein GQ55_9G166100 [Panicum hallii var. hallii]|uniref:Uncharacterized protein n=1 Tax=Panicum hallii var. hallii TaxID=1504633 RepID=A0A2T7C3X9_9POAL|nr:hypothetical protein GQ55_9G166100 [Panicum hallii var. hallii]
MGIREEAPCRPSPGEPAALGQIGVGLRSGESRGGLSLLPSVLHLILANLITCGGVHTGKVAVAAAAVRGAAGRRSLGLWQRGARTLWEQAVAGGAARSWRASCSGTRWGCCRCLPTKASWCDG